MKKIILLILVMISLVPLVFGQGETGEVFLDCDFTTSCIDNLNLTLTNNASDTFVIENLDNGTLTRVGNTVGGASLELNIGGWTTARLGRNFTIEVGYKFTRMSASLTERGMFFFCTTGGCASADNWAVAGVMPSGGDRNNLPESWDSQIGGTFSGNGNGSRKNEPFQTWRYVWDTINGVLYIQNESTGGNGDWITQGQHTGGSDVTNVAIGDPRGAGGNADYDYEIDTLKVFNGTNPPAPPPPPAPDLQTFTITTIDTYDGTSINQFNISIFNESFSFNASTTNGTIFIDNRSVESFNQSLYNITFSSNETGGYFNRTFRDLNITTDGSFIGDIFQAILRVNATQVFSGNTITNFNFTVPSQFNKSNSSGFATLFLKAADYNFSIDAAGFLTSGGNFSINNFEDNFLTVEFGTGNVTITAFSGDAILNFDSSIELLSTSQLLTKTTTDGTVIHSAIAGTYNITINASGFSSNFQVVTVSINNNLPNITFNLFTQNSINITIFDEELNLIINTTTTTLVFDHVDQKFTDTTTNGTIFLSNLFNGLWNLLVSTPFHTQRNYIFTITSDLTILNVYLLNTTNGESKIFTIKNVEDERITGATLTVSNKINNTFVTVAQKISDFAGQANIFLRSDNNYRFTVESDGFSTKVFDLEPIASSYDIVLSGVTTIDFTNVFDKVSYTILPESSQLISSNDQNISIIVSSPKGFVSYFGLNSSFNGTDRLTNVTGSVAGGTASISINTSNITGLTVPVSFFIKLSDEDIIEIDKSYYLAGFTTPGNASAQSFADTYSTQFSEVMKALLIVLLAVAVILTLGEVGAPAAASGVVGAIIIIGGAVIGWIPITVAFIVGFILIGMFFLRRGD